MEVTITMQKKKILLVDDELSILDSFAKILAHAGYEVTTAASGEEAITKLQADNFDIVLTDLAMPGIDGLGVLMEAKKQGSHDIGSIIITGYGDMTSAIEALRLGADDYIVKPCNVKELLLRVEKCLEKYDAFRRVKAYENILPICMYCKNIRDDTGTEKGEGKWLLLEEYLHKKSGVNLSHGICPECFRKHAPK